MIDIFKKTLSDTELAKQKKPKSGSWISAINPNEEEIKWICEIAKLERDFVKSALDIDEKPRIEIEDENILIIIQIPFLTDNGIIETFPISIIITPKFIISVMVRESTIIADFYTQQVKTFYTNKKTRFCFQILAKANRQYQKFLTQIEKKIEVIERSVTKSFKNEEIVELLGVQKSLIYINTAIVSNDKVLEKIMNGKVLKLYEEDQDLLQDIIIDNKQSIDMVNIYINILSSTMDAYASLISNNLNMVMKFLASITIILAIPTIVASFYGMNVNLPFQSSPYAFLLVVIFTTIVSSLLTFIFMKKNFF